MSTATNGVRRRIEPFYFGPGEELFGCYHAPAKVASGDSASAGAAWGATRPRTGVVLANAHGHEYVQFHRAFRQLAMLLAEKALPVLRFDFRGCGDSAGGPADWSLDRWHADLAAAAAELRRRARVKRVIVIGLRLGGAVAARLGAELAGSRDALHGLVLWDPVLAGPAYLAELRAQHREMLGYAHVLPELDPEPGRAEILGFPLPDTFRAELEGLTLEGLARPPAPRVLVVESHEAVPQAPLAARFSELAAEVRHERFSNPHLWVWLEDFGKVHVPRGILDAIAAWTEEAA